MRVICEIGYEQYYTGTHGKVFIKFEKGKTYQMLSEYDNCYLFYREGEAFLVKKLYFLTIQQVLKRGLLSINMKI